jgi:hypothetical protein
MLHGGSHKKEANPMFITYETLIPYIQYIVQYQYCVKSPPPPPPHIRDILPRYSRYLEKQHTENVEI